LIAKFIERDVGEENAYTPTSPLPVPQELTSGSAPVK
jgi:hypothetical protein